MQLLRIKEIIYILGTILNVMTIAVLTRPSMISPVNVLLCSVAICDVLVMASYLIFVIHFLINAANRCLHTDYSYPWTIFTLIHAHASVILHSTSIWLTVSITFIFSNYSSVLSHKISYLKNLAIYMSHRSFPIYTNRR